MGGARDAAHAGGARGHRRAVPPRRAAAAQPLARGAQPSRPRLPAGDRAAEHVEVGPGAVLRRHSRAQRLYRRVALWVAQSHLPQIARADELALRAAVGAARQGARTAAAAPAPAGLAAADRGYAPAVRYRGALR